MKSIICGFTLVSAAAAQIVVNGLYSMPSSPSVPTATPGAVGTPTSNAAPLQVTAPPTTLPAFYQQMPYSSYMNGGYQSLDCGYGYHKSNGHCVPYSWVIILSTLIETPSDLSTLQFTYQNECYATTIINNMFVHY